MYVLCVGKVSDTWIIHWFGFFLVFMFLKILRCNFNKYLVCIISITYDPTLEMGIKKNEL